jgi:hypothetical protein
VARPGLGDELAVPLDGILEPEARAAQLAAPRVDEEAVVEPGRQRIPDVDLRRRRLDPLVAQSLVAAVEASQVLDPSGLEPDEVGSVVRDPLRVGLREADGEVELERVAVDGETLGRER